MTATTKKSILFNEMSERLAGLNSPKRTKVRVDAIERAANWLTSLFLKGAFNPNNYEPMTANELLNMSKGQKMTTERARRYLALASEAGILSRKKVTSSVNNRGLTCFAYKHNIKNTYPQSTKTPTGRPVPVSGLLTKDEVMRRVMAKAGTSKFIVKFVRKIIDKLPDVLSTSPQAVTQKDLMSLIGFDGSQGTFCVALKAMTQAGAIDRATRRQGKVSYWILYDGNTQVSAEMEKKLETYFSGKPKRKRKTPKKRSKASTKVQQPTNEGQVYHVEGSNVDDFIKKFREDPTVKHMVIKTIEIYK